MDIELPGENGIQLTRKIRAAHRETVIVMISNYDTPEYQKRAMQAGAAEFFSKLSSTPGDIVKTVRSLFF